MQHYSRIVDEMQPAVAISLRLKSLPSWVESELPKESDILLGVSNPFPVYWKFSFLENSPNLP